MIAMMPTPDEMLRRLIALDGEPHLAERFFPVVVQRLAAKELAGAGVVMGLMLATAEYCKELPEVMEKALMISLSDYVRTLVDEPQVQQDALETLRAIGLPVT